MKSKVKASPRKGRKFPGPKPRVKFTEQNIVDILNMYHKERMSMSQIAALFASNRQAIAIILKKHDIAKRDILDSYDPSEVRSRGGLDAFERAKLLSSDAQELMEHLLSLSKYKISNTIKTLQEHKDNPEIAEKAINMNEITKLIQIVAPYTIESKRSPGAGKEVGTPKKQLSKFMQPLKKAN